MAKIPVGATIAHAYRFAFSDFFKILGVMWLAMAIMWAPGFLLRQQTMALSMQMAAQDYSSLRNLWPLLVPLYLAMIVLMFMQIVGVARLALDRLKGKTWFYFDLGTPVWRLIGTFLLLIVAAIIGWIAVLLGGVVVGFLLGLISKAVNNSVINVVIAVLTGLAFIALWCGYFYSSIRLTFLLAPVIAAGEEGFALARSWALGKGNFWRAFAILLVTLGPFFILEFAFLFGFVFKGLPFPPLHASATQTAAYQAALNTRMLEMMNANYHYWYITYPLGIAIMVVFFGLAMGGPCFAYRALTEGTASAPVAAD
jgi:hypothetical protein